MLYFLLLCIILILVYVRWQEEILQLVNGILPARALVAQSLPVSSSDEAAPEEGIDVDNPFDLDNSAAVETTNQLTLAYANSDLLFPSPLDKFFFSPFWENRPSLAAE